MSNAPRTALVTGSAGFIGYHLCARLLADGFRVIGLDGFTDYYDVTLKQRRHQMLSQNPAFVPVEGLLETDDLVMSLFETYKPDAVIHLAGQAGVRWSIENPRAYVDANLIGSFNIIEAARAHTPEHLLMASTSSVFGANTEMPYAETDKADTQMSFYAATKKANELMAHTYAHLYQLPCTGLRFFTVYGPWGRPDMAFFKFTKAILAGEAIPVYNHGQLTRDFTYIDDIVEGILRVVDQPAESDDKFDPASPTPASSAAPARVLNIGNGNRVQLMDYIATLEACLGVKANYEMLPMQSGDVIATHAEVDKLSALTGYQPSTDINSGLTKFCEWFREYYGCHG